LNVGFPRSQNEIVPQKSPWNKGKAVGQKSPFRPREVQIIKQILENAGHLRDLALFSVGIDTMLRGIDLLALKVEDITDHEGEIVEVFVISQHKSGKATLVALLPYSRQVLKRWIAASSKLPWHYLFTSVRKHKKQPITTNQYRRLVKRWAAYAKLDPHKFSTHSLRRTKAALVYQQTHNVEVVRQLLGQSSITATSAYLGIDQQDALEIARKFEI
jgi:integrase